jgi:hypothetical protein
MGHGLPRIQFHTGRPREVFRALGSNVTGFDDLQVIRDNINGGNHVTTGRQVRFCTFTDPGLPRVGLSEKLLYPRTIFHGVPLSHSRTASRRSDS